MKRLFILLLAAGLTVPALAAETKSKKKSTPPPAENASGRAQTAAKSLTPSQRTKLLDLINSGDEKALQSLPGIGETRAAAIKKARPITDPVDLVKVEGIGDETLVDIVAHAKAGFPEAKKEEAAKPKSEPKKKAPAKKKTTTKKSESDSEKKDSKKKAE